MSSFTVTVQDQQVTAALKALSQKLNRLDGVLLTIGAGMIERTQRRFETSTGPDGAAWKPNSAATLGLLSKRLGGQKSKTLKGGGLNKSGRRALAGKKPLIDHGDLRTYIVAVAAGKTLTVTASQQYAAIQQFGGKAGRGLKVTIPARPFLPVKPDGSIYQADQAGILKALNEYLSGGF